jgi:UDP-GlcNAc:undecaprenyl-phosphate/decaprenyl-phosphate GlcNAc-1-phosphate transferase
VERELLLAALIAFVIALSASLGLTVPVRHFALRVGMVDRPGPRKVHAVPIPLLGGLAIYSGVALAILIVIHSDAWSQILGIFAGATLVATVGFLDDRGLLHHQIKLLVAMPAAAAILLLSGIRTQVFSVLWPGRAGWWCDTALTLVWVIGITAAFSILDHMDGLCAGIAATSSFFFAVFALHSGQWLVGAMAAAIMGAAIGFLRWNFTPAKIFMGDGGAMFLGFLMATLALKLRPAGQPPATWLVPLLILGVPIFDTTLVSISRSRRGLLPFTTPGKDHTAHRLSNLGLRHRGAVLLLYGLGTTFGLAALALSRLGGGSALAFAAAIAIVGLAAVAWLERAPFERQSAH